MGLGRGVEAEHEAEEVAEGEERVVGEGVVLGENGGQNVGMGGGDRGDGEALEGGEGFLVHLESGREGGAVELVAPTAEPWVAMCYAVEEP